MRLRPWLKLSSLGVGTYLGSETEAEDEKVTCGIIESVGHGINVIDTARNYRCDTFCVILRRYRSGWVTILSGTNFVHNTMTKLCIRKADSEHVSTNLSCQLCELNSKPDARGGKKTNCSSNVASRHGRGEQSVGAALAALKHSGIARNNLFLSTKAGFVPSTL